MNFYEDLFQDFEKRGIRYLVVGGVAVILHGFLRATADLDLMVALDADNLDKFLPLMKSKGYRPKAPVPIEGFADPELRKTWIREKNMLVFSLYHPQKPNELIDIFIQEPISFAEAYQRKSTGTWGTTAVSIASAEDLVELKRQANRPQDIQDIVFLEKAIKERDE